MQELAQQSQTMERETWDSLLSFLLAINDALLAPPAVKDDVGDQLCERVLGVLNSTGFPRLFKNLKKLICLQF